jgi:hypothetical protein
MAIAAGNGVGTHTQALPLLLGSMRDGLYQPAAAGMLVTQTPAVISMVLYHPSCTARLTPLNTVMTSYGVHCVSAWYHVGASATRPSSAFCCR